MTEKEKALFAEGFTFLKRKRFEALGQNPVGLRLVWADDEKEEPEKKEEPA